jgi:hypothetical protein
LTPEVTVGFFADAAAEAVPVTLTEGAAAPVLGVTVVEAAVLGCLGGATDPGFFTTAAVGFETTFGGGGG